MITDAQITAAMAAWHGAGLFENSAIYRGRMRAALEAAEREAWRPISEAPRDGTVVDLWFADPRCTCRVACAVWRMGHWFVEAHGCGYHEDPAIITHFRPLPAPPVTP